MALDAGMCQAILLLHGRLCRYCGADAGTIDHIIPIRQGGSDAAHNLTAACRTCNCTKKHHRLPHHIERDLLQEAAANAKEATRIAQIFREGRKAAVRRPPIPVETQHLLKFVDPTEQGVAPTTVTQPETKRRIPKQVTDLLRHGIRYHSINVLHGSGIQTLKQLLKMTPEQIAALPSCGKVAQENIRQAIASYRGSK